MTLTKMRPEHIPGVRTLLEVCFGKSAWTEDMIRLQLLKPEAACAVALENSSVIGYLAYEQILDEGSIVEVAVHPDYRRQGIAKKLITEMPDARKDLSVVFLEVRESNTAAIALYESLGFEKIGVRKGYYDHPKDNAIIMRKNL